MIRRDGGRKVFILERVEGGRLPKVNETVHPPLFACFFICLRELWYRGEGGGDWRMFDPVREVVDGWIDGWVGGWKRKGRRKRAQLITKT